MAGGGSRWKTKIFHGRWESERAGDKKTGNKADGEQQGAEALAEALGHLPQLRGSRERIQLDLSWDCCLCSRDLMAERQRGREEQQRSQEDGKGSDFIQGDRMKHDLKEKKRRNKEHNLGIRWNTPVWHFTNFLFLKT